MLKIPEYNKITGEKIDLNIFINQYGFKPEYDKETGELIELYRINGFYLGENTRRRKSTIITKQQNNDNCWKYNGDLKNYWFIDIISKLFKCKKFCGNCHILSLDEDDYEILYDLIQAGLVEKVEEER